MKGNRLSRRNFIGLSLGAAAGTLLVGCGQQSPVATEAPVEETSLVAEATQDVSLTNLEQIERLSESKVNVTGWHPRLWTELPGIETLSDQVFDQKMEEITNVHIDWTSEAGGGAAFDAIMAGGDLPDCFALGANINTMTSYGVKGAFIPLTDYIDANPYLSGRLAQNPLWRASITAPDGNIYFFPRLLEGSAKVFNGLNVRQDWLDEVGMEPPTTTDELYEVAKAFKAQDASRYPITFGYHGPWIIWQFGVHNNFVHDGDTVIYGPLKDGYREALAYSNRLFSEELIEPYWQNVTPEQQVELQTTPLAGLAIFNQDNIAYYKKTAPDVPWVPIPMVKGPYGHHQNFENYSDADRYSGNVITSSSTQQDLLARYCDLYFSDSGSTLMYYGVYGDTYTEENGKKVWTDKVLESGVSVNAYAYSGIGPNYFGACYLPDQTWIDLNPGILGEAVRIWADNDPPAYTQSQLPDFILTEEEYEIVQTTMADIKTLVSEYYAKAILGEMNIEDDYVALADQIRTMGINEATAAYQSGYDRYLDLSK
ncbi:MAG: extracellular solute-binding protein [Chloroflexi bacterium]|nr:extracellular solute-binding protein [Chloroflexota bacterium]